MAGRLSLSLLALMPALATGAPAAQSLPDPTRPPADLTQPSAPGQPGSPAPAASGLQSVILKKEGRPAALINGMVVELGGMVGEAKLVKVDEDSVVLLGPEGRETLQLTPEAEKKQKVGAGGTAKSIGMNAVRGEKKIREGAR